MEQTPPWKPEKPPYLEKHWRGQPSSYQLGLILFHHGVELLGRKTHRSDMERLAADLMAPTASPAEVKIRDAAWAKRDKVWAEYHRACRKYEEAQEEPPTKKSRAVRKGQRDEEQEKNEGTADKEDEKCTTYVERSLLEYDQDPAGLASLLEAYIAEEAKNPAIKALALSGMCECAGSLGTAASWAMLMWFAAQACRRQLGDASLDTMDDAARSTFLINYFQSLPKLEGEAAAAFEDVSEATREALGAIKWPQAVEFNEAQCRKTLEKVIGGAGRTRKLDREVRKVCDMSYEDLMAKNLDEDQKIKLIVDKKRAGFVTPLEKISDQLQFFNALVANPDIGLEDVFQLMSTVMFLSHGSAIGTILHCGVMDPRVLEPVREAYLVDKAAGKIKDPEAFYAKDDCVHHGQENTITARKFTIKLMQGDVPSVARRARCRLSIKKNGLSTKSLLTAEGVVPVLVLHGAVKDLKKTRESAQGIIVVADVLDGHIYHVQCGPNDFAVTNQFTVNCALRLFTRFAPVLALAPRQPVSSVLPLKMEEPGDGGYIVGDSSGSSIVAEVKSVVHRVVHQLDPILGAAAEAVAANKVSNVPARLLAARLASASSSDELPAFNSTADGLPKGFGFDVAAWSDLIKSMPDIDDISKAVGSLGHILCSCPTPAPTPAPAPAPPNPNTNVNGINLGHNWTNQEHVDTGQDQGQACCSKN